MHGSLCVGARMGVGAQGMTIGSGDTVPVLP